MEIQELIERLEATNYRRPKFDPAKAATRYRIDPTKEVPAPPVIVSFNDIPICTKGNFSLITGKAKSRKTFLVSCMAASGICGFSSIAGLTGSLNEDDQVLYFDTEQSTYHLQRTVQRICLQSGNPNPPNFAAYGLRPLSPAERLELVEHVIQTSKNPGLVIIDGVRDLLSEGINCEAEATSLTSKILRWTYEKMIHVVLVLHQNKADNNARGHIGSELSNKAEAVLSVAKDSKYPDISIVTPEYCRGIEPASFAFRINETGLPEITEETDSREKNRLEKIGENLSFILPGMVSLTREQLVQEYMEAAGVKDRSANYHISEALRAGILVKGTSGNYKLKKSFEDEPSPF